MDKSKLLPGLMIAIGHGKPSAEPADDEGGDEQGLEAAGQDLLDAIKAEDAAAVAHALSNAFAILDKDEPAAE
jgi:hypothetical protein